MQISPSRPPPPDTFGLLGKESESELREAPRTKLGVCRRLGDERMARDFRRSSVVPSADGMLCA